MPRDEDKMNINLNEYGDCIVVRGVYRETGHLSVVITDLENNVLVREREYYWFNELKATLNNNTPNQSHTISSKIWRDNNKEYLKKYEKEYKEKNKEQIKIRTKAYYEKNKDKQKTNCKKWISNEENREKNRIYQRERCRKIAELKKLQKIEVNSEEL